MWEPVAIAGTVCFWGAIAAIIILPRYFKSREREGLQATLRMAIEKGQPLPPEVIDAIGRDARPTPSAARDLRAGVIWIGVAATAWPIGMRVMVKPSQSLGAASRPSTSPPKGNPVFSPKPKARV